MPSGPSTETSGLFAPLTADPASSAILTDVDGTLAPIVERADEAAVPAEARDLLSALSDRYALVGCISGRRAEEARRIVGLDGLAYSGNHGLELLMPGADVIAFDMALGGQEHAVGEHVAELDTEAAAAAGLRNEDKGPIQAFHWRGAPDEAGAEVEAQRMAHEAESAGLSVHWGRKVLELRPPGGAGKDRAIRALLGGPGITAAIYAGDDRTDLDAFTALREAVGAGTLKAAVCVGVYSAEGPAELAERADLMVDGTAGWLEVLRELAG